MNIFRIFRITGSNILLQDKLSASLFHNAIRFSIKLAQVFSYFPIYIGNEDELVEFKWLYWRIGYSLITFSLFITEFGFVLKKAIISQITLIETDVFVFHFGAIIQYILFLRLTYYWPELLKEWAKVEFHMRSYEILGNLRFKLACLVSIIMFIAGVEHTLVNAYKLNGCFVKDRSLGEVFKNFFLLTYSYIFESVEYSIWIGIILQFLNLQRTFYWNYTDVFIMLMGSALTFRMRQISNKIKDISKLKVNDIVLWKTIRKDYTRLSQLCFKVNEKISGTIILCFLMDMYFVLLQLYKSLMPIEDIVEKLYFFISFGLLLLRLFCICTFGGAVYEEWRNIRFTLNTTSASAYNSEVDRLINHVSSWELALSGKNFFFISRGLILQIAGAIVTYELVLIQFYKR